MESTSAIAVRNLSFSYQNKPLLKDLTFSIAPGELVGLIGPNGSGKTTLLKILLNLLTPSDGTVKIHHRSLSSYAPKERAKTIAYVAQQPVLSFPLTVEELVSLGRYPHANRQTLSRSDHQAIANALQQVSAEHLRRKSFNILSGGEKQKVLIARALAQSASILLLDEPTLHLDLNYQLQILAGLKKLCTENRITVLTVLHDVNLASQFADKALLLKDGVLHSFGPAAEVINEASIKALLDVDTIAVGDNEQGSRYFVPRQPFAR
ncbi:MAG: ABC transporter ATP-binding protein [Deltaproteobacteria bacterium]|nr:ABC transporter ATP-binding protein [Deltaproteobacteria bacterium]MBM4296669.1 ABC transporter ATP-binding protein [Deltaproteobacteria bacterium]